MERCRTARGGRPRHPAATRNAGAAVGPRWFALPAAVVRRGRHGPLRIRSVRRLPGPVRRRLLHRQGHLRRRCLRGRTSRAHSREHDAQSRPVRGRVRARGTRVGRRGGRGIPGPLRRRRTTPTPLDAWRLAAPALGAWTETLGCSRAAGGPLEDDRQSAAIPTRANEPAGPRAVRLAALASVTAGYGATGAGPVRASLPAQPRGAGAATHGHPAEQPPAPTGHRPADGRIAGGLGTGPATGPGLARAGRHHPHPDQAVRDPPAPAGMDNRRPVRRSPAARRSGLLWADGRRRTAGRGIGRKCWRVLARGVARGVVPAGALARGAGPGLARQPSPTARTVRRAPTRRCPSPAAHGAPHLALFRDLRDASRAHAATGQLSGRPAAGGCAPYFTHQRRPVPAVGGGRPRLRLGWRTADLRAPRSDFRHPADTRTVPWPFLQLVRHAYGPGASTGLCVVGGQRQLGGPPDRAGQRLRGMGGRAAAGRLDGWCGRCTRAGPRVGVCQTRGPGAAGPAAAGHPR